MIEYLGHGHWHFDGTPIVPNEFSKQKLSDLHISEKEKTAITEFSNRIKSTLRNDLLLVKLFGSKVRGDFREYSDIDIYILVRKNTAQIYSQIAQITSDIWFKFDIQLSPVVYDAHEEDVNLKMASPFFQSVYTEGIRL